MYNNLNKYSAFLLMSNNIIDKKEELLTNYYSKVINMMIYNIVSLTSILSIVFCNSNKVTSDTIILTKKYINDMCKLNKKIKGGSVLPSEYFGLNSGSYNSEAGTDVSLVDFDNFIAKPALGVTGGGGKGGGKGGCMSCMGNKKGGGFGFNKQLLQIVSNIFKEHKIKIDKSLKQELVNTIKVYIYLLTNKLQDNKNKMNLSKMKTIIKKSRCYKLTI